jgi:hypothetical protein
MAECWSPGSRKPALRDRRNPTRRCHLTIALGADQFVALLGPGSAAACEDPRRPGGRVVARTADQGGVAIGGQRDGLALLGGSNRAVADQLIALLGPDTAAARVDPCRPSEGIVAKPTHDSSVAVGGKRDGAALQDAEELESTAPVPTSFGPCCVNCATASCDERSGAATIRTNF